MRTLCPARVRVDTRSGKLSGNQVFLEDKGTALISNDTQDDIIALVVFGFTLAIIVGVLGYVIGRFNTR